MMYAVSIKWRLPFLDNTVIAIALFMLLLANTLIPFSTVYAKAQNQTTVDSLAITLPVSAHSIKIQYSTVANANPIQSCQENLDGHSQFTLQFSSSDHHSFAFGSKVTLNAWSGQKCDSTHFVVNQKWILPDLGKIINSTCVLNMNMPQTHPTGCTTNFSPDPTNRPRTSVTLLSITLLPTTHSLNIKFTTVDKPTEQTVCQKNLNGDSQFSDIFDPGSHSFAFGSKVILNAWSGQNCGDGNHIKRDQIWILPDFRTVASSTCDLNMNSHKTSTTGC